MPERPKDSGNGPTDHHVDREAALGGADAVEKTTYVTGAGTEPETIKPPGVPVARVPAGGGQNATWFIIGALFVAAVLIYVLGLWH